MPLVFTDLYDVELIRMIRAGAVGVLPTDTIYGVVAAADNPIAVAKMYALKQREHKPGPTIAASVEQLIRLGVDPAIIRQVTRFWPAALSIVLPLRPGLSYIDQGLGASPFRVVSDTTIAKLLEKTGPLVTSSANQPGEPPAMNIAEAQDYFSDQVDFYVDSGQLENRQPSTIATLGASGKLHIVRQGETIIPDIYQI